MASLKKKHDKEEAPVKKEPLDPQEIFKQNLKYISATELTVETISNQFVKTQTRYWLTVGIADFPTGEVVVADPLCYLAAGKFAPRLTIHIPMGSYPVDVAICRNEYVGIRMCTARLRIKDTAPVRYELARPTPDSAAAGSEKEPLCGFPVDAGTMCFCDAQAAAGYLAFLDGWHKENEGKNHYDDYFAAFFAASEKELPAFQREGGDFIAWRNPSDGNRMVMVASGFGDGFYQSYWGYDAAGDICSLVVPMVNPDLFD